MRKKERSLDAFFHQLGMPEDFRRLFPSSEARPRSKAAHCGDCGAELKRGDRSPRHAPASPLCHEPRR